MDDAPTIKLTLRQAADRYLESVAERAGAASDNAHTRRSFEYALRRFLEVVQRRAELDPAKAKITRIDPEWVKWFIDWLKRQKVSPATERLRLVAVRGFYNFLSMEGLNANPARVSAIISQRARSVPAKERNLDTADVDRLIAWAQARVVAAHRSQWEKLRALRDYAFVLLLVDTGLRVSEACSLTLDALPRPTSRKLKLVVAIKGGDETIVRLSPRAWRAIRAYLRARAALDKASGLKAHQLPVFAQHSRMAGARQEPPTRRATVRRWEASGAQAMFRAANAALFADDEHAGRRRDPRGRLTPHSLRHYFITKVWRKTGDLRLAQKLGRHRSITSTQRYAHADDPTLDDVYSELFGEQPEQP